MKPITVGVLLDPDLEYGVGVLEGVRTFGRGQPGWRVLPLAQAQEPLLARLVRSGELQGLVGTLISDRWLQERFPAGLPLVNTSNLSRVTAACSVVPDDEAVGRLAARHFHDLGLTRAGLVSDRATYASQLRREGFLLAAAACGLRVDEPAGGTAFRLETAWQAWVEALPQDAAVFCTSDALARRLHLLCRALPEPAGRRVSRLAGAGDSLTERAVSGLDLTSVPLPAAAVGARAAARLARLLAGERALVRETVPPGPLIVRGSSARFAAEDVVVARALGLALQSLGSGLGVDELARRAGVSRRTLEQRFRAAFGHGPARELRDRRLEQARRLLLETDLGVAEVAARCGAGSPQAFTTLFRRAFGRPPGDYRRAAADGVTAAGAAPPDASRRSGR